MGLKEPLDERIKVEEEKLKGKEANNSVTIWSLDFTPTIQTSFIIFLLFPPAVSSCHQLS